MDMFGIGNALQVAVNLMESISRRTGRTQRVVRCADVADTIVCPNPLVARHITHLLQEKYQRCENLPNVVICDPRNPAQRLYDLQRSATGNVWFDHTWVEAYFKEDLARSCREFDRLNRELNKERGAEPVAAKYREYRL